MSETGVINEDKGAYKVRGLLYGAVFGWMNEYFGSPERFGELKKSLPPDMQKILSNFDNKGWMPSELKDWYPAGDAYLFYEKFIDYLAPEMSEEEIIDELVGFMFRQAITGFMKGLMSFLTPASLIKRSSTFWRRVHSAGEVTIKEQGKGKLVASLSGWKVHRISCLIFSGWTKHLLELTGRTMIEMKKTGCVLEEDDACTWEITYR